MGSTLIELPSLRSRYRGYGWVGQGFDEFYTLLAARTRPLYLLANALFGCFFLLLAFPALTSEALVFPDGLATLVLGGLLTLLSVEDFFSYRLPNMLTGTLVVVGLAFTWWFDWDGVLARVLAVVIGYGILAAIAEIYVRLRHRHGLGLGDAKLLGAAGAWLGYEGLPGALLTASLLALLAVIVAKGLGRTMSATTKIPFGPFLASGIWIGWLYGPPLAWL